MSLAALLCLIQFSPLAIVGCGDSADDADSKDPIPDDDDSSEAGDGDGDGDGDEVTPVDDNKYSDPLADTEPRPAPDFGENVFLFDTTMPADSIQSQIDAVFMEQESDQMGEGRYAFLLRPGAYNLDINVGYYTDVMGLGASPDDTEITGAVRSEADWFGGNSTHNFWRSASNMKVIPLGGSNRWAVSQAAPFRRMHVMGGMTLHDDGWSSGGFLADSVVEGEIDSGSQQQWFSRNSRIGSWQGEVWNMFFLGVEGAPNNPWPAFTILESTPLIREKPYLFTNAVGNFYVHVPALRSDTRGTSWEAGPTLGRSIAIEEFYLARPDVDDADTINAALASGKNLLILPGVYHLEKSIQVTRAGTVVLGLGLPSLLSAQGNLVMEVADVDGVKIAGLTIDAGTDGSETLMRFGPSSSDEDHADNPTSAHDVFCRIGGGFPGSSDGCVEINSNNLIGDHFWLWRADHGNGVGYDENVSKHGLVVNGDDVSTYGLFVEHFHEYQTIWNGERGRTYFYQCEMPYDPPSQSAWQHDGVNGYAGYKVSEGVLDHEAWGLGVYSVFHDAPVVADNAIEVPATPGVKLHHMVIQSLGGNAGQISSVVNGVGGPANADNVGAVVDEYPVP